MEPLRLAELTSESFIKHISGDATPIVITGAMYGTDFKLWCPNYLRTHFGQEEIQVYDRYFNLKKIMTLSNYFDERFDRRSIDASLQLYARWYTKLRDVDFPWADKFFSLSSKNWVAPAFMPVTDYLLPLTDQSSIVDVRDQNFPAKGLFLSERGASTGLHVDPWGSDAILCQMYGQKRWLLYSPDQKNALEYQGVVADLDKPDLQRFPNMRSVKPVFECTLNPGEVIYVPRGWYHAVYSETDSVSITWNFVHKSCGQHFLNWLKGSPTQGDIDVVRHFTFPESVQMTAQQLYAKLSAEY